MLTERLLLVVSLVVSLLGLVALFALLLLVELPVADLSEVDDRAARDSATVRVQARVVAVRQSGNVTILTLAEAVERKAVVFAAVNVTPGLTVDVTGTVKRYRGVPELVVERLLINGSSADSGTIR